MATAVMKATMAALCCLGVAGSVAGGLALGSSPALAQDDLFAAAVTINGTVVTRYEVRQRLIFLQTLRQTGDLPKLALDGLIADRLQFDAAKGMGVTISVAELQAGLAEFAGRAKLSVDDFVKAIALDGVAPETFRDFVKSGLLWRAVLRAKFAGRITITEAEVDRAIAQGAASGGPLRVQLLEIVVPDDGTNDVALIAQRIERAVKNAKDFALQARLYSKVDTAAGGGSLGWLDVTALPPEVAAAIADLQVGEMTAPLSRQGAVTIYFLQGESQSAGVPKGTTMVDYAVAQPGGGADLAQLQASLTMCDQLNPLTRGQPAEALQRQTVAEASVPAGLRSALAVLDAGESAVIRTANGGQALLMLCARMPASLVPPSRDDVRAALVNQKVSLLSEAYLEELRSQAIIKTQ